jgi:hypothetical protein
MSDMQQ